MIPTAIPIIADREKSASYFQLLRDVGLCALPEIKFGKGPHRGKIADVRRRGWQRTGQSPSDFTVEACSDCGLSLYAEMESRLVLIAKGYSAFEHLAQLGGKAKDQQIQCQNRQQYFAHHAVL